MINRPLHLRSHHDISIRLKQRFPEVIVEDITVHNNVDNKATPNLYSQPLPLAILIQFLHTG